MIEKNKCDTCANEFTCTSETGNCDENKESYTPLEQDEPVLRFVIDEDGVAGLSFD